MAFLDSKSNYSLFDFGQIIPMEALSRIKEMITTPFVVFMDNDTLVNPQWLQPLIETAQRKSAAAVYPLILERSGVDAGDAIRTHLFTTEIRGVKVEEETYLIEHKTYRRVPMTDLPTEAVASDAFELHCVLFRTDEFLKIETPAMTIREHLDIGLQLKANNKGVFVEPRSQVVFDNLGSKAKKSDLHYFDLRWNRQILEQSSRLFEKRWGYRFYSEEAICNWAARRRLFMMFRRCYVPIVIANLLDRVLEAIRRRLFPVWDPLPDPLANSMSLSDILENESPKQLSTDIR